EKETKLSLVLQGAVLCFFHETAFFPRKRPFVGKNGAYTRTSNRHDYSLEPPSATLLDDMKAAGFDVIGIGKIADIFAHRGLTETILTKSNEHGMEETIRKARTWDGQGLVMTNLVEFDSLYGHRNDAAGYKMALEAFDKQLAVLVEELTKDDLLIITADHGCDPTTVSTDHSREYVPILAYCKGKCGVDLGVRKTFADVSATVRENFAMEKGAYGTSFLAVWKENE
ncbi:MAG: phosphopentomutase, partial [Selenomonadales bacterium]|nr:phosphopentomutase [Selenomonadales bacterium]